jgi:hypothetical protein
MSSQLKDKVEEAIDIALSVAKKNWDMSGNIFESASMDGLSVGIENDSRTIIRKSLNDFIGTDFIGSKDRELICISADLRNSTDRIKTTLNYLGKYDNKFQRAFYITSALLPSLEVVISHYGGFVTEYLGDGVLGFFDAEKDKDSSIRNSGCAARFIVDEMSKILQNKMKEYYEEETISIGVGLAISPTLLSKVGTYTESTIKAFGPCVYDASKRNHGFNEVLIEPSLEAQWPKSKKPGTGIKFKRVSHSNMYSFKMC